MLPMTALTFLALAAGCSSTAEAPAGDAPAGSGLSGEMIGSRGTILGNVGAGGLQVNLHLNSGGSCNTQTAAQQSTTSGPDGSYTFSQPVPNGDYCIEYGGQSHSCGCNWSSGDTCTCSPPSSPGP
jgi:hypothetical protein